jgi:hypothetical protein
MGDLIEAKLGVLETAGDAPAMPSLIVRAGGNAKTFTRIFQSLGVGSALWSRAATRSPFP